MSNRPQSISEMFSKSLGLQSWPLVSGGKGIHVVVPLVPKANWDEVKDFCHAFAELVARTDPHRFVSSMSMVRRKGRMFLDYLRNGQGAIAICPWSTRARLGGTVAVPITWSELDQLDRANGFDIFAAATRAKQGDAWAGYFDADQILSGRLFEVVRAH